VKLSAATVSRQHARLVFRDGGWIVQDVGSLNRTLVNGVPVGRCRLRPGDRLTVADQLLRVD
jgi:pilus assembly protein CpaF